MTRHDRIGVVEVITVFSQTHNSDNNLHGLFVLLHGLHISVLTRLLDLRVTNSARKRNPLPAQLFTRAETYIVYGRLPLCRGCRITPRVSDHLYV